MIWTWLAFIASCSSASWIESSVLSHQTWTVVSKIQHVPSCLNDNSILQICIYGHITWGFFPFFGRWLWWQKKNENDYISITPSSMSGNCISQKLLCNISCFAGVIIIKYLLQNFCKFWMHWCWKLKSFLYPEHRDVGHIVIFPNIFPLKLWCSLIFLQKQSWIVFEAHVPTSTFLLKLPVQWQFLLSMLA